MNFNSIICKDLNFFLLYFFCLSIYCYPAPPKSIDFQASVLSGEQNVRLKYAVREISPLPMIRMIQKCPGTVASNFVVIHEPTGDYRTRLGEFNSFRAANNEIDEESQSEQLVYNVEGVQYLHFDQIRVNNLRNKCHLKSKMVTNGKSTNTNKTTVSSSTSNKPSKKITHSKTRSQPTKKSMMAANEHLDAAFDIWISFPETSYIETRSLALHIDPTAAPASNGIINQI